MYILSFLYGVTATITIEVLGIVAYGIYLNNKEKKKK